ncbi:MAG TPA: methyltransferase domain-containing protein [Rhodocyclaceae bacterium]|nr:methyltransferase domain-containing protein [Rhodocyclaceae bacterium]
MWEQSKSARRRYFDGAFHARYFVGSGIDIGGGPDQLGQYCGIFPLMQSVRTWDLPDGDAQYMTGVADNSYDFVHSSHCLEHMRDPLMAMRSWLRILKPGGHCVVTIPDEDMYELGHWPSRFNSDHKWTFTMFKRASWSPVSVNVLDLAIALTDVAAIERIVRVSDFFRPAMAAAGQDQTMTPVAECAIEMVLQKSAPVARQDQS